MRLENQEVEDRHLTAEQLKELSNERFTEIVDLELKNELDTFTAKNLRSEEVIERWYFTLVTIKKSIESQLGARKTSVNNPRNFHRPDYPDYRERYLTWRPWALRQKSVVEERMLEYKSLRISTSAEAEYIKKERDTAIWKMHYIVSAILSHKNKVTFEYDATDADLELWNILDKVDVD